MEIIEKAPAKINLGLDVLRKRSDGFHDIDMVMASVDLADRLQIEELVEDEIIIETNKVFLPLDQRNHVYQGIELIKKTFNIQRGVRVNLMKTIPVAAGLAGGSSDCAAVLRGLNRMWNLGLTLDELAYLGGKIGSDVPYCIYGKTAFVCGRGDEIELLPPMPQCWVVMVKPRMSVSTPKVFAELELDKLPHQPIERLVAAIKAGDYHEMIANMGNSLETITMENHPIVAQIKERMLRYGADVALMSGSGPTVFALCEKYSRAQRVSNALKGFCDEVYLVRTLK